MTKWKKLEQERYEHQMEALKSLYGNTPDSDIKKEKSRPVEAIIQLNKDAEGWDDATKS